MYKTALYRYLGVNGVIESPVRLEDTYYIPVYKLTAEAGKILTDGETKTYRVTVPFDEVANWKEVDAGTNN